MIGSSRTSARPRTVLPLVVVTRAADGYIAQWRRTDGVVETHPITAAQYPGLPSSQANPTADPGAVCEGGVQYWTLNTPSGTLEPGTITDAWPGEVHLGMPPNIIPDFKGPVSVLRRLVADMTGTVNSATLTATGTPRVAVINGTMEIV